MTPIDHLVFACSDLESGIENIADHFGVKPGPGGRHPSWGTHNAVLSLGDSTYFEIIAPDPNACEVFQRPEVFDGTHVGGLTTWAAGLDDLTVRHAHARRQGHGLGRVLEGSRVTESGVLLEWSLTDPMVRIEQGLVPFLIDWGRTPHPARSSPQGCRLLEFTLSHPDPAFLSGILSGIGISCAGSLKIESSSRRGLRALIRTPRGEIEVGS